MRILLVNQFYPPDLAPTGRFLEDLAGFLVRKGHEVHVICSKRSYSKAGLHGERTELGVHVKQVAASGFGRKTKLGRMLDYASFFITASSTALFGRRYDVSVCLTTPPYIGYIGLVLRLLRGTRSIQWVMDLYPDTMVAHGMLKESGLVCWFLKRLTRRLLRSADDIWALGPFARDKIAQYLTDDDSAKIEVVPLWGLFQPNPWMFAVNRQRAEMEIADRLVVMYSGNMGLGHEFDTILDAARRLQSKPGVLFVFVGNGTRGPEVRRKVKERRLKNVVFKPYVPRRQLCESLSSGDVHVLSQLPSWQGLIVPSKLASIFAVGRPAVFVGAEQNEIAQWIREAEAGYVVPVGDSQRFVRVIEEMRRDVELRQRLGHNGYTFFETYLAPQVTIPKLAASIEGLGLEVERDLERSRPTLGSTPAKKDATKPLHR